MATKKNTTAPETAKVEAVPAEKKIPLNTEVACTNLTNGVLIYISKKQMGYQVRWNEPGDVEYIELGELISMRNSQRAFFEKSWIGIDDPDIIKFLKVEQYYKNVIDLEDAEDFFNQSNEQIASKLEKMSEGYRENVKNKAIEMINNDEIDSIKKVKFLKEYFGLNDELK